MHEDLEVATELVDVDVHIIDKHGNLLHKSLVEVAEDLCRQDPGFETVDDAYFELLEWGYKVQGRELYEVTFEGYPVKDRALPLYRIGDYQLVPPGLTDDVSHIMYAFGEQTS